MYVHEHLKGKKFDKERRIQPFGFFSLCVFIAYLAV